MPESANYSPYGHPKGHMDANGNWVRNADSPADEGDVEATNLKLAVSFATADGAVLYTVPAGQSLYVEEIYWEITESFTGGTSSAIGASTVEAPHNAKGALIGGAAGDVAAALTAGNQRGTAGTAFAKPVTLQPGMHIRFDRIASAFTAGAGFLRVIGRVS